MCVFFSEWMHFWVMVYVWGMVMTSLLFLWRFTILSCLFELRHIPHVQSEAVPFYMCHGLVLTHRVSCLTYNHSQLYLIDELVLFVRQLNQNMTSLCSGCTNPERKVMFSQVSVIMFRGIGTSHALWNRSHGRVSPSLQTLDLGYPPPLPLGYRTWGAPYWHFVVITGDLLKLVHLRN